jgi:hypothetical protein
MATWRIQDGEKVRVDADGSMHCATYDLTGTTRTWTGANSCAPTAEELAAWDAEAPAKAAELAAERRAIVAATKVRTFATVGTVKARYDGTCAVTGRAYRRNTPIRKTSYGWAIADERTMAALTAGPSAMIASDPDWLTRQMARDDSTF